MLDGANRMKTYSWEAALILPVCFIARVVMLPVWVANWILLRLYNQIPIYVLAIPAGLCALLLMTMSSFVRMFAALSLLSPVLRPIGLLLALPFLVVGCLAGCGVPPIALLGSGIRDQSIGAGVSDRLKQLIHFPYCD